MQLYSIREARPDEQRELTRLCVRATLHVGYDEAFIDRVMPGLTVTLPLINAGAVQVAQRYSDDVVGVVTVTTTMLQGIALLLFLPFDGLGSLFVIAALFGLFQGGIVPSYAIIVREYFPAREAGARVGTVLMFTLLGMALGGWMSGKIFDITGSYHAAFINGLAWNLLNITIAVTLLRRAGKRRAEAKGALAGVAW